MMVGEGRGIQHLVVMSLRGEAAMKGKGAILPCSPAMACGIQQCSTRVFRMLPNQSHLLRKGMTEEETLSWKEHFQG